MPTPIRTLHGRGLFDAGLDRVKHSRPPLADVRRWPRSKRYPGPKAGYLHFDSCLADLRDPGDVYRLGGFWTCFYHNLADLFGMEE